MLSVVICAFKHSNYIDIYFEGCYFGATMGSAKNRENYMLVKIPLKQYMHLW